MMTEKIIRDLNNVPNFQKKWIEEVKDYIHQNIGNCNFVIKDISTNLGISERQLYRRIKAILGITPNLLIRQLRMERARSYLEAGDYSTVAEVSYAVGYNRSDYFSNEFEKIYGKRPIAYFYSFKINNN